MAVIVGTSREAEVRRAPALAALFGALVREAPALRLGGLAREELRPIIARAFRGSPPEASEQLVYEITGGYRFAHILIAEALRQELAPVIRMRLHGIAARVLEDRIAEQPEPNFAEVAHHYFQAAATDGGAKATEYALRAGDQAFGLLAYEDAAVHYERAIESLTFCAPDEPLRCELLLRLGEAQRLASINGNGAEVFKRAAAWARQLGDPIRLSRAALGFASKDESGTIDHERIAILTEALDALAGADSGWRARILGRLASALYFSGDRERYRTLSNEAVAIARRAGDASALVAVLRRGAWRMRRRPPSVRWRWASKR